VCGLSVVKLELFIGESPIDVDIFLAETPFQLQLLQRRQRHQAGGLAAWFVGPEDLVLLKLLAARPKDLVDVGDVIFIQGQLDEAYLQRWAGELGVSAALDEALRTGKNPAYALRHAGCKGAEMPSRGGGTSPAEKPVA
jgi:hypothetical protein